MLLKKRLLPLLLGAFVVLIAVPAFAEETLEKTHEYTSKSNERTEFSKEYSFESNIEENGKKYKLKETAYEVTKTTYPEAKYHEETRKSLDKTLSVGGVTYNLVSYKTITDSKKATSAQNDFPQAKDGMTLKNVVVASQQVTSKEVPVIFYGADGWGYEWNGHEIEADENGPVLGDLQESFGESLGGKFRSIRWSGPAKDGNREAICTIDILTPVYEATYETVSYKCTYENKGAPIYGIKATATYIEDTADEGSEDKKDNGTKEQQQAAQHKPSVDKIKEFNYDAAVLVLGLAAGAGIVILTALQRVLKKKKSLIQ